MKSPEQASVDYTSSRTNEVGGKRFTPNHGPRNFNDATNTWKEKPNYNWAHTHTFTSPQGGSVSVHSSSYQMKLEMALLDFDSNHEKRLSHLRTQLEQQQDDMIGKINLLWKIRFQTTTSDTVKNPKLGTYPVLSARSYPTIDPQCSSHIHSSINAIIIHPKQPEESHDNEPDIGHEAKGSFGNINSNQHPQPDPLASIATEQVRKLNSMLESLGLVP
ncbi:hypothetical protein Tco_0364137 [Tanacetum coccineum]